jgi:predicted amino acid racemase
VGVNLTCYGGVLPSVENMTRLVEVAEAIEARYGLSLDIISGGNSSSLKLLASGKMPSRINHLRLGESVVLGFETAEGTRIPGTEGDAFTLAAEIVELQTKPSVPVGEIGRDAFGQVPVFEDRGMRRRAIVAAGRQDLRIDAMSPRDDKIIILGASSDHMILDVTDSSREWQVGDAVEFDLAYGALLAATTSPYVTKEFI